MIHPMPGGGEGGGGDGGGEGGGAGGGEGGGGTGGGDGGGGRGGGAFEQKHRRTQFASFTTPSQLDSPVAYRQSVDELRDVLCANGAAPWLLPEHPLV